MGGKKKKFLSHQPVKCGKKLVLVPVYAYCLIYIKLVSLIREILFEWTWSMQSWGLSYSVIKHFIYLRLSKYCQVLIIHHTIQAVWLSNHNILFERLLSNDLKYFNARGDGVLLMLTVYSRLCCIVNK